MATFWPDGLCKAELYVVRDCRNTELVDLPDNAVCALADDILDVILVRHVEGDFPRSTSLTWLARHDELEDQRSWYVRG